MGPPRKYVCGLLLVLSAPLTHAADAGIAAPLSFEDLGIWSLPAVTTVAAVVAYRIHKNR